MTTRKDLIIGVLATFCLASTLFTTIITTSQPVPSQYDPWIDTNDDGIIDIFDLVSIAQIFGTTGTPINKTALLLELQDRVDRLNASLLSQEAYFKTRITTLETTVVELQSKVDSLAIAYNATWSNTEESITPIASWTTIPEMEVRLTLNQTSFVRITMSARMNTHGPGYLRAIVDSVIAYPGEMRLNLVNLGGSGFNEEYWSMDFYLPNVTEGSHTIAIQYYTPGGLAQLDISHRILIVTAFPAQ